MSDSSRQEAQADVVSERFSIYVLPGRVADPRCRLEPLGLMGSKRSAPDIHGGKHRIGGPTQLYLPGSRDVLGVHPTIRNGSKRQCCLFARILL
jgi:hypothetical protein